MFKQLCLVTTLSAGAILTSQAKDLQQSIEEGAFSQAIEALAQKQDNKSKFSTAICQLGGSLEKVQQGLYQYGFEVSSRTAGIRSRSPLPHNPQPEVVNYAKFRQLLETFNADLQQIEKTLANIGDDDFTLPLDLTKARFDVDKDGKRTELESSMALVMNLNGPVDAAARQAQQKFDGSIHFDKSDLIWLKGYIQVTLGVTDLLLAHDFQQPFDALSASLFQKPENALTAKGATIRQYDDIADLIAAFHLAKMPIIEPERLKRSRLHFLSMVDCSKAMWKSILAETDNSKEWLPSPKQQSVTGISMTDEMVTQWHVFLDEYQAILEGKKLVPHWRFKDKGVNLKRAFEESTETDIILWITGHAAIPFLEEGPLTEDNLWRQLNRSFNGNFLGMSFFIN